MSIGDLTALDFIETYREPNRESKVRAVAEEQSKATNVALHPKEKARRYRDGLKRDLEKLDEAAAAVAEELKLEGNLLPRNAYIGAPGTYARHVYNTLREAGR